MRVIHGLEQGGPGPEARFPAKKGAIYLRGSRAVFELPSPFPRVDTFG